MIECKVVIPFSVGDEVFDFIDRDLTAAFGGVHVTHGNGLWCDPDQGGRVVSELIVTYVCAVPSTEDYDTFRRIVAAHCRAAGERYLYISQAEGRAEIVPLTERSADHD